MRLLLIRLRSSFFMILEGELHSETAAPRKDGRSGELRMSLDRKRLAAILGLVLLLAVIAWSGSREGGFGTRSAIFPVKAGGKYGFINNTGKLVVQPQFDDAGKFDDGLAPVSLGGKWGYVDRDGKLAVPPQFELADPFSDDLALVAINRKSAIRWRRWVLGRTGSDRRK
jgi:hypothetical protein